MPLGSGEQEQTSKKQSTAAMVAAMRAKLTAHTAKLEHSQSAAPTTPPVLTACSSGSISNTSFASTTDSAHDPFSTDNKQEGSNDSGFEEDLVPEKTRKVIDSLARKLERIEHAKDKATLDRRLATLDTYITKHQDDLVMSNDVVEKAKKVCEAYSFKRAVYAVYHGNEPDTASGKTNMQHLRHLCFGYTLDHILLRRELRAHLQDTEMLHSILIQYEPSLVLAVLNWDTEIREKLDTPEFNDHWEQHINEYLRDKHKNADFAWQPQKKVNRMTLLRAILYELIGDYYSTWLRQTTSDETPSSAILINLRDHLQQQACTAEYLPALIRAYQTTRDQIRKKDPIMLAQLMTLATETGNYAVINTSKIFLASKAAQAIHGTVAMLHEVENRLQAAFALQSDKATQQAAQLFYLSAIKLFLSAKKERFSENTVVAKHNLNIDSIPRLLKINGETPFETFEAMEVGLLQYAELFGLDQATFEHIYHRMQTLAAAPPAVLNYL